MTNERDIERYLVKLAKANGWLCRKVKFIGHNGAPDRVLMAPGILVWVELKAPGKKPTMLQLAEHARMRAMGQTVMVIDSKEAVEELFT